VIVDSIYDVQAVGIGKDTTEILKHFEGYATVYLDYETTEYKKCFKISV
jgi:hypothetical protein